MAFFHCGLTQLLLVLASTASSVLCYDESFFYLPSDVGFGLCTIFCSVAQNCTGNEGCQVSSATTDPALVLVPFGTGNNRDVAVRFMRDEPVQLWDSSSGDEASVRTFFVMRLSQVAGYSAGDGMTFLIAPDPLTPQGSQGGNLGLFQSDDTGTPLQPDSRIVALKFDTHNNSKYHDPPAPYVGLDINNLVSSVYTHLDEDVLGQVDFLSTKFGVWLEYNATTQSVEVSMMLWPEGGGFGSAKHLRSHATSVFTYGFNLKSFVEEFSYVGFSAGTGHDFEINEVFYWEFETTGLGPRPSKHALSALKLALLIAAGLLLALLLFCLCLCCLWCRRRRKHKDNSPILPSIAVKLLLGDTVLNSSRDGRKSTLRNAALVAANKEGRKNVLLDAGAANKEKRRKIQGGQVRSANRPGAHKHPGETEHRATKKKPGAHRPPGDQAGNNHPAVVKHRAVLGETELSATNEAQRETKAQKPRLKWDSSTRPTSRSPGPASGPEHMSSGATGNSTLREGVVDKSAAHIAGADLRDKASSKNLGAQRPPAEPSVTNKHKPWSNLENPGAHQSPHAIGDQSLGETRMARPGAPLAPADFGHAAAVATSKETGRSSLFKSHPDDLQHAPLPSTGNSMLRPASTSGAPSHLPTDSAPRPARHNVTRSPSGHSVTGFPAGPSWATSAHTVPAAVSQLPSTIGEPKSKLPSTIGEPKLAPVHSARANSSLLSSPNSASSPAHEVHSFSRGALQPPARATLSSPSGTGSILTLPKFSRSQLAARPSSYSVPSSTESSQLPPSHTVPSSAEFSQPNPLSHKIPSSAESSQPNLLSHTTRSSAEASRPMPSSHTIPSPAESLHANPLSHTIHSIEQSSLPNPTSQEASMLPSADAVARSPQPGFGGTPPTESNALPRTVPYAVPWSSSTNAAPETRLSPNGKSDSPSERWSSSASNREPDVPAPDVLQSSENAEPRPLSPNAKPSLPSSPSAYFVPLFPFSPPAADRIHATSTLPSSPHAVLSSTHSKARTPFQHAADSTQTTTTPHHSYADSEARSPSLQAVNRTHALPPLSANSKARTPSPNSADRTHATPTLPPSSTHLEARTLSPHESRRTFPPYSAHSVLSSAHSEVRTSQPPAPARSAKVFHSSPHPGHRLHATSSLPPSSALTVVKLSHAQQAGHMSSPSADASPSLPSPSAGGSHAQQAGHMSSPSADAAPSLPSPSAGGLPSPTQSYSPHPVFNKERVKKSIFHHKSRQKEGREKQGLWPLIKHKPRRTFLEKTRKTLLRLLGLPTKIIRKKPRRKYKYWIPPGPTS